jgi:tellurite resistance protein
MPSSGRPNRYFEESKPSRRPRLSNFQATMDAQKSMGLATEIELAQAHEAAANRMAAYTVASIETELRNYQKYFQSKLALYGADEKSQADKAKFEIEAGAKIKDLLTQIEVAQVKSDTTPHSVFRPNGPGDQERDGLDLSAHARSRRADQQFAVRPGHDQRGDEAAPVGRRESHPAHAGADPSRGRVARPCTISRRGTMRWSPPPRPTRIATRELEIGLELARSDFQQQESFYRMMPGLVGQADLARQKGFELLQAENELRRKNIDETIFDEQRKGAAIIALDVDLNAKRRGIITQFPTFWEQQLQSIVASNVFFSFLDHQ